MEDREWLTEQFEELRPQLRAVAYRMLGSLSEAEDAVQEAWLRLHRSDTEAVGNLGGWLTTVVGRVCLDMLRARRARREEYAGTWLPDPIVSVDTEGDPEHEALLVDSVGRALLVVLDTLTPAERIAFVLHDMFAVPFEDIGPIVGRSSTAARQLASRARRRVQGAAAVAREVLSRGAPFAPRAQPAIVNGAAGAVVPGRDRLVAAVGFTISRGRIAEIDLVADPEKLRALAF